MKVALLGAKGMIGQQYIHQMRHHPWFELIPLAHAEQAQGYPLVLTALPNATAQEIEKELVARGCKVISSAAAHRLDPTVPLLIPEVNPSSIALLKNKNGWIVTKPNCTVHTFVLSLTPLHHAFGITHIQLVSMQALSGAGKKGLEDPYLKSQVFTWIADEEQKCETEPLKIWSASNISIAAQCNRVPVDHGHVVSLSVRFQKKPTKQQILDCWRDFAPLRLPSSPAPVICYYEEELPPLAANGMQIQCARLRSCPHFDWRFVVKAHNLIRGGAGAGCLIAEYLYQEGCIA